MAETFGLNIETQWFVVMIIVVLPFSVINYVKLVSKTCKLRL